MVNEPPDLTGTPEPIRALVEPQLATDPYGDTATLQTIAVDTDGTVEGMIAYTSIVCGGYTCALSTVHEATLSTPPAGTCAASTATVPYGERLSQPPGPYAPRAATRVRRPPRTRSSADTDTDLAYWDGPSPTSVLVQAAAASMWIQRHQSVVAILAVVTVTAVAAGAVVHRWRSRRVQRNGPSDLKQPPWW